MITGVYRSASRRLLFQSTRPRQPAASRADVLDQLILPSKRLSRWLSAEARTPKRSPRPAHTDGSKPENVARHPRNRSRRDSNAWRSVHKLHTLLSSKSSNDETTGHSSRSNDAGHRSLEEVCSILATADALDLCKMLVRAREELRLDLLSYLGLIEHRWALVARVIRTIAEGQAQARNPSAIEALPYSTGIDWGLLGLKSELDERCASVTVANTQSWQSGGVSQGDLGVPSLDAVTAGPDPNSQDEAVACRIGLGQVWRSLGHIIIQAAKSSPEQSAELMPHVLHALAILHHHNAISDQVYHFNPPRNSTLLRQPPTLYLLSRKIFTLLANAAFEVENSRSDYNSDVLIIPYRVDIDELGPELWLELILWSCLHGDWIADGAAILQQLSESGQWSLICWQDILASQDISALSNGDWAEVEALLLRKGSKADDDQRRMVHCTVSSELIAAYVDGLVDSMSGTANGLQLSPTMALAYIKRLKHLLDKQSLGLGHTTWDAMLLRIFEADSTRLAFEDPTQDYRLIFDLVDLIQPFGRELQSGNLASPLGADKPDSATVPLHLSEPSAACLGFLHRAIDSFANYGDVEGALNAYKVLQDYTDLNKRRSIEDFFESCRQVSVQDVQQLPSEAMFTSNTSILHYPAFHPQLSNLTLAKLLVMSANNHLWDFGNWMLFSEDVDGCLVPKSMYNDPVIAAAVIHYATASGQKSLLQEVVTAQAATSSDASRQGLQLPPSVLQALIEAQIHGRSWKTVETILHYNKEAREAPWQASTALLVAKEVLLLQYQGQASPDPATNESLQHATQLLRSLLRGDFGQALSTVDNADRPLSADLMVHNVLGLLSSISPQWATFCNDFITRKDRSAPLTIPVDYFHEILDAVCTAHGLEAGAELWRTWCRDLTASPRTVFHNADDYFEESRRVVLRDVGYGELVFRERLKPTLSSVRILLRHVLARYDSFEGKDDMTLWSLSLLKSLMPRDEDWQRELERLTTAGASAKP